MLTIVIPLGVTSYWGDNELRYHLRSLQQNILTDFEVVVLSDQKLPDWAANIRLIRVDRFYPEGLEDRRYEGHRHYENFFDTTNKLYEYCMRSDCPKEFVWAYDDQLLLKPIVSFDMFNGVAVCKEKIRRFDGKRHTKHENTLIAAIEIVRRRTQRNGVYNCETHAYKPYNRDKLRNIFKFDDPRGFDVPYAVNTVYQNMFCDMGILLKETREKLIAYLHWADGTPHHFVATDNQELNYIFDNYTMLSYNDTGLFACGCLLQKAIEEKFPAKSIFEI